MGANRIKISASPEINDMKECTKCKSTTNGFYKDLRLKSGEKSICKICDQSYMRSEMAIKRGRISQQGKVAKNKKQNDAKYRSSPKGRIVAKNQKYKRRSVAGQGKIKHSEWLLLLAAFDGNCAYCMQSGEITIDHITPLSKGGKNDRNNILPCCRTCNSKKQAKSFYSFCDEFTQKRITTTLQSINEL
jgi:5-methylcytosine-specific restriction endonuclease McrA